jgi:hypothetical protein
MSINEYANQAVFKTTQDCLLKFCQLLMKITVYRRKEIIPEKMSKMNAVGAYEKNDRVP